MSRLLPALDLFYDWPTGGREVVYHNLLFDRLCEDVLPCMDVYSQPIWPNGTRSDIVLLDDQEVVIYELKAQTANARDLSQLRGYISQARWKFPRHQVTGVLAATGFHLDRDGLGPDVWLLPMRLVRL